MMTEDRPRLCVRPHDILFALEIACRFEKDLHKAKQMALTIMDWAIQESDSCPPQKLLDDANRVRTKR
jgi:hypothetical protein